MNHSNPFDELFPSAQISWTDAQNAQFEKLDNLVHKVFQQSDAGRELLDIWSQALKMTPTAQPGYDQLMIGIEEGKKQFIRSLITTIRKVEDDG